MTQDRSKTSPRAGESARPKAGHFKVIVLDDALPSKAVSPANVLVNRIGGASEHSVRVFMSCKYEPKFADWPALETTKVGRFSQLIQRLRHYRSQDTVEKDTAWRNWRTLVMVDCHISEKEKATLADLVMSGISVVAGPESADDFMWEMKATANSRGIIFEVAESRRAFDRLSKTATEALSRRPATWRYVLVDCDWIGANASSHRSNPEPVLSAAGHREGSGLSKGTMDAFEQLPGVVVATADLRAETGRLDANLITELFGLTRADLARLADRTPEAIRQTPDAESLQPLLQQLERCARLRVLNDELAKFRVWLRTANEELDEKAPIDVIKAGRVDVVANLVEDIISNRGH